MSNLRQMLAGIVLALGAGPLMGLTIGLTYSMFHHLRNGVGEITHSPDAGIIIGLLLVVSYQVGIEKMRASAFIAFLLSFVGFFEVTTGHLYGLHGAIFLLVFVTVSVVATLAYIYEADGRGNRNRV